MSSPQNNWAQNRMRQAEIERDNSSDSESVGTATITALLAVAEALLAIEERLAEIGDRIEYGVTRNG